MKDEKKILLLIVVIALGIRLFLMLYFKSYVIDKDWDFGWEAGRIAKSIAEGEGFSSPFQDPTGQTAWMMPLYPYFLAFIFKIFGVYSTKASVAIFVIHSLASSLTCVPLYYIGKIIFGKVDYSMLQ